MIGRCVLMAVVLAGCGVVTDPHLDVEVEQDPLELLDSDGPPPGAELAIEVVLEAYALATGLEDVPEVTVRWVSEPLPYGDGTASGLTYGCTTWAVWREGDRFPRVLLAHELGHCVRRTLTGDGDGAHSDAEWWAPGGLWDLAVIALVDAGY